MSGTRWTADEDARLRDLVGRGATYGEVASQLGRTRNAVTNHATEKGLRNPSRLTVGFNDRLRSALAGGEWVLLADLQGRVEDLIRPEVASRYLRRSTPESARRGYVRMRLRMLGAEKGSLNGYEAWRLER